MNATSILSRRLASARSGTPACLASCGAGRWPKGQALPEPRDAAMGRPQLLGLPSSLEGFLEEVVSAPEPAGPRRS